MTRKFILRGRRRVVAIGSALAILLASVVLTIPAPSASFNERLLAAFGGALIAIGFSVPLVAAEWLSTHGRPLAATLMRFVAAGSVCLALGAILLSAAGVLR